MYRAVGEEYHLTDRQDRLLIAFSISRIKSAGSKEEQLAKIVELRGFTEENYPTWFDKTYADLQANGPEEILSLFEEYLKLPIEQQFPPKKKSKIPSYPKPEPLTEEELEDMKEYEKRVFQYHTEMMIVDMMYQRHILSDEEYDQLNDIYCLINGFGWGSIIRHDEKPERMTPEEFNEWQNKIKNHPKPEPVKSSPKAESDNKKKRAYIKHNTEYWDQFKKTEK